MGLGFYKWYQSHAPGGVPVRTLSPQGGWIVRCTRWCASKDSGPKEVDCEIPYRLEKERSISNKGVKTSPNKCVLRPQGKPKREIPKKDNKC